MKFFTKNKKLWFFGGLLISNGGLGSPKNVTLLQPTAMWNSTVPLTPYSMSSYVPGESITTEDTTVVSIDDKILNSDHKTSGSKIDSFKTKISAKEYNEQLPSDCHTWIEIRNNNYTYVDKTNFLQFFVDKEGFLYLFTRTRRLGKTVLVHTLKDFFEGNETNFRETAIHPYGNTKLQNGEWKQYPVLHFNFVDIFHKGLTYPEIMKNFVNALRRIADDYNILDPEITDDYHDLVLTLSKKFNSRVIILVDEYDVGLSNILCRKSIENIDAVKDFLDFFFSQLKSSITNIKFAWLTGVNRYGVQLGDTSSMVITDLTYDERLSTMVGFTKDEIEHYFNNSLNSFAVTTGQTVDNIMSMLTNWYDGYNYNYKNETDRIYNPISVIKCLKNHKFQPYWSVTTSIRNTIKQFFDENYNMNQFRNITIPEKSLTALYNPTNYDHIPFYVRLFNMGYLTIKYYDENAETVTLDYPNNEIKNSLQDGMDTFAVSYEDLLHGSMISIRAIHSSMSIDRPNIPELVRTINNLACPHFEWPLDDPVEEKEVTRRLSMLFNMAGIQHTPKILETDARSYEKKKKTKGVIDLLTSNLHVNFAIEIKCGNPGKGIQQLMDYFLNENEAFSAATRNPLEIYLLILNFSKAKNSHIIDWVFIPCQRDVMLLNKIEASSNHWRTFTKNKYKRKLKSLN